MVLACLTRWRSGVPTAAKISHSAKTRPGSSVPYLQMLGQLRWCILNEPLHQGLSLVIVLTRAGGGAGIITPHLLTRWGWRGVGMGDVYRH